MFPIEAARLLSLADVEYRRQQLTHEFEVANRGRLRRAVRRRARRRSVAPVTADATVPALVPGTTLSGGRGVARPRPISTRVSVPASSVPASSVPASAPGPDGETSTVNVVDERLPVA